MKLQTLFTIAYVKAYLFYVQIYFWINKIDVNVNNLVLKEKALQNLLVYSTAKEAGFKFNNSELKEYTVKTLCLYLIAESFMKAVKEETQNEMVVKQ